MNKQNGIFFSISSLLVLLHLGLSLGLASPDSNGVITGVKSFPDGQMSAGLGDYVLLKGENLSSLLKQKSDAAQKVLLYIDGLAIRGSRPEVVFENGQPSSLLFRLDKDSASAGVWKAFYQYPREYVRNVTLSAGFEETGPLPVRVDKNFQIKLIRKDQHIAAWIFMVLLFLLFLWLAFKSCLLRDNNTKESRVYSLSRSQLAFWTLLVSFSFLYIWAVTGEFPPITASTLILLGISIGTTAGASLVDSQNSPNLDSNEPSKNFLVDILSDSTGISIHRFQMLVWTLIMGFIFVRSVAMDLSLPQFNDGLLALMGISSGSYVALKIPENKAAAPVDQLPPAVG